MTRRHHCSLILHFYMELAFKSKIQSAEERLLLVEAERPSNSLDQLSLMVTEFNALLATTANFKEKQAVHLLLAKLNRQLFNFAQLIEIKTFHFENAVFELTEALILSKLQELKLNRKIVTDEAKLLWEDVRKLPSESERARIEDHFNSEYFKTRIASTFDVPSMDILGEKGYVGFDSHSQITEQTFQIMKEMTKEGFDLDSQLSSLNRNSFYEFSFFGQM